MIGTITLLGKKLEAGSRKARCRVCRRCYREYIEFPFFVSSFIFARADKSLWGWRGIRMTRRVLYLDAILARFSRAAWKSRFETAKVIRGMAVIVSKVGIPGRPVFNESWSLKKKKSTKFQFLERPSIAEWAIRDPSNLPFLFNGFLYADSFI